MSCILISLVMVSVKNDVRVAHFRSLLLGSGEEQAGGTHVETSARGAGTVA